MKYKGYEAIIECDEEERLFVGRVINIKDIAILIAMKYTISGF